MPPWLTLDNAYTAAKIIGLVGGVLAAGVAVGEYKAKNRAVDVTLVTVAVGVLRQPVTEDSNEELRQWARAVIDRYSEVPLPNSVDVLDLGYMSWWSMDPTVATIVRPDTSYALTAEEYARLMESLQQYFDSTISQ